MNETKESIHLLFYSKDCEYSDKFNNILKQFPLVNVLFKKHAIEDLQQLPSSLEQVPSIVINGEHLLGGQEAFNWLETQVKDSFTSGPALDKKSGYSSELGYSSFGNETYSDLDTKLFSSINQPAPESIKLQDNNGGGGTSQKENDMNSALEQYQRDREGMFKNEKPKIQPNFSMKT